MRDDPVNPMGVLSTTVRQFIHRAEHALSDVWPYVPPKKESEENGD
jgi:hypothetical protein